MTMQIIKSDGSAPICWENPQAGISSALDRHDSLIKWILPYDEWTSLYLYSIHEDDTVMSLTNMFESNCVGYIGRIDIVANRGTRRRSAFIHFIFWGFNWFTQHLRRELEHARDTQSGCKITDPNTNNWIYSIAINHKPIVCEPLNIVQLTANDAEMSERLIAQQSKIDELTALVADLRQKFEGLSQGQSPSLSQGTNASSLPSLSQGQSPSLSQGLTHSSSLSSLTVPNNGPPITLEDLDTSSRS